jgi:hypothetical protein
MKVVRSIAKIVPAISLPELNRKRNSSFTKRPLSNNKNRHYRASQQAEQHCGQG